MKRTLMRIGLVVVLGLVLWQGAVAVRSLFREPPHHRAVIHNTGRRAIGELELRVGAQRFALGPLAARESTTVDFRVARDTPLELRWTWEDAPDEAQAWRGEWISRGPLPHRLSVTMRDDGGVLSRVMPVER